MERLRSKPGSCLDSAGAWLLTGAGLLFSALLMLVAGSCANPRARDGQGAGRAGSTRIARHHVVLHGIRFDPESLTVAVGDTVEWDNHDVVPHTSTAADRLWFSGNIAPDSAWSTVIARAGVHPYGCSYHPNMKARLIAR